MASGNLAKVMEGHKSSPRAAEQAACAKGARHGENSKGNCVLEGGDIEIIASDVEEDLGEGKLEWFEKIWELPSEKQRFSIRSWKFLEKRKKKIREVEVLEAGVAFIHGVATAFSH